MSRVLIAGCGYVGTALGELLAGEGAEVWGLRRKVATLPASMETIEADLLDPGTLRALPGNLDYVFYTAAASRSRDSEYEAVYRTGLRHLLAALSIQGQSPRRVVFTSSTGVYGMVGGSWVDEKSQTDPGRAPSHHILAGERITLSSPFASTVVRFSGIYGPGRTRLIKQLRSGEARCQHEPVSWTNRIHRDDCAGALAHVARLTQPENVYVASDNEPAPYNDVLLWLAERIGVEPPQKKEGAVGTSRTRGRSKRCRNDLLLQSGYRFRHPTYREGYDSILEDASV